MGIDELIIKKWRRRGGGLRHDPRLSERKIAKIISDEYGVPSEIVRYHISIKDKRYHGHYDLKYKQLARHIDTIFPQVFNSKPELQLKEISSRIENLTGISLKERTLERLLGRYEGLPRGSPIVKTEAGNYRLNDLFYQK